MPAPRHHRHDVSALVPAKVDLEFCVRPISGFEQRDVLAAHEHATVADDHGVCLCQVGRLASFGGSIDFQRLIEGPWRVHSHTVRHCRYGGAWRKHPFCLYREHVPYSPLALAALASVAVPGLDVYDVLRSTPADADYDVVVVVDATGTRWTVRAPRSPAAGAALEAELSLLHALAAASDTGSLSFAVPRPAGTAPTEDGAKAIVYEQIRGSRLNLAALEPGPGLAASLGRSIAQIHELPATVIEDQGLPVYTADAYRERRLAELDAATQTGRIPPSLAERWESQLEDVSWWRYEPTVVHANFSEHRVIVSDGIVAGVLSWMDARVADPADDLAWLVAAAPDDVLDSIVEAYHGARRELRDPHLLDRARLASELALARWLLHGVRTESADVVDDAIGMLADLEELLADQGQP